VLNNAKPSDGETYKSPLINRIPKQDITMGESSLAYYMLNEPVFEPLRGSPRFEAIAERLKAESAK
jgi:hypothetical protein